MRRPVVSFIVPVLNDSDRLERCLRSIKANDYPKDRVELVVADNGSIDDSRAVAEAAGARVLTLPKSRLGELRNQAAAVATGDVLAFVDADHEIGPNWLSTAVEVLSAPEVAAVGTACSPPATATYVQRLYDRLRHHPASSIDVEWLGSGNMAVTRAAFQQVGGFDTQLETCEDVDLCRKIRGSGYRIVNHPGLRNVHYGDPETLSRLFFGEMWRGRDNVRVSLRPPLGVRNVLSAAVPALNLFALLMLAAGIALAPVTGLWLVGAALLVVAALVGLRSVRMVRYRDTLGDIVGAIQVAAAYELGRALAVVGPWNYGRRRGVA